MLHLQTHFPSVSCFNFNQGRCEFSRPSFAFLIPIKGTCVMQSKGAVIESSPVSCLLRTVIISRAERLYLRHMAQLPPLAQGNSPHTASVSKVLKLAGVSDYFLIP